METVAFRLPEPLKDRIQDYADKMGESKSVAGRELLQQSFDQQEEIERLRAENERLREDTAEIGGIMKLNGIVFSLMVLGAFFLGGSGSVTVNVFGLSTGAVGLGLFGAGFVLSAIGYRRLMAVYLNVFGDSEKQQSATN